MEAVDRRALRLARLGFADAARADGLLGPDAGGLGLWSDGGPADDRAAAVVSALGRAADPDRALLALARLTEADPAAGTGAARPAADRRAAAHPADRRARRQLRVR